MSSVGVSSVGEITLDLVLNSEQFENRVSEIARQTADSTRSSTGFADSLNKLGGATTTVGTALLGISAPITGIGIASTKSAMTFEDSMAKVMTIADQTEVSYDDMKTAIMKLSDQTGISSNEIADNVYNAISAGQKTGDAVNFVSKSTKLAKAGFADAGSALDILTTILNAYGLEAGEVGKVSDMLIQTQNKGKVTVGELSSAMGKVIPTANANNVALDQLCSGYAIMTANGVACAESTTYMNSMLNELGKSGTKVSDIIKDKTGMSFAECMKSGMSLGDVLKILDDSAKEDGLAFTDLWGSAEAGKAGLILLGNEGKEFNSMLGEMQDSTGATETAFKTLDTTSYTIQKALNEVKNSGIQLGGVLLQTLAPVITNVCDAISKACEWFNNLDDTTKKIIFAVSGVITVLGLGLVAFGKLAVGISSLITAFSTIKTVVEGLGTAFTAFNPTVLIVIGVITALIAIGVLLYQNWDVIKEKLSEFAENWKAGWQMIKDFFTNVISAITTFLTDSWENIKAVTTAVFTAISNFFISIWETIKSVITTAINGIKNGISNTFNEIRNFITAVMNTIKSIINAVWNSIKSVVTSVLNAIKSTVSNIFNSIKSGIQTAMGNIFNTVKDGFSRVKGHITGLASEAYTWGKDMIMGIVNGIKSCMGAVGDAVSGVADKIKSFLHFSVPDEGPLTDYETWMPDFMQGLAKGIRKNENVVGKAVGSLASLMQSQLQIPDLNSSVKLGFETPELRNVTPMNYAQKSQGGQLSEKIDKLFEMFTTMNNSKTDGDIIIPVYVGGNVIDEIVVKAQDRRKLRSGGMA